MKKVYTKAVDVIELFVNREQSEARGGNVFFEDTDTIYSYGHHYELGRFLDSDTILINDEGYSKTTKRHVSKLYTECHHSGVRSFFESDTEPRLIVRAMETALVKYKRARRPNIYKNIILDAIERFDAYDDYNKMLPKDHHEFKDWSVEDVEAYDRMLEIVKFVKGEKIEEMPVRVEETSMKELQELFNF